MEIYICLHCSTYTESQWEYVHFVYAVQQSQWEYIHHLQEMLLYLLLLKALSSQLRISLSRRLI